MGNTCRNGKVYLEWFVWYLSPTKSHRPPKVSYNVSNVCQITHYDIMCKYFDESQMAMHEMDMVEKAEFSTQL